MRRVMLVLVATTVTACESDAKQLDRLTRAKDAACLDAWYQRRVVDSAMRAKVATTDSAGFLAYLEGPEFGRIDSVKTVATRTCELATRNLNAFMGGR